MTPDQYMAQARPTLRTVLAAIQLAPRPPAGGKRKPAETLGRHMTIRLPPDLWKKLHESDKKMIEIIEKALRLYYLIED